MVNIPLRYSGSVAPTAIDTRRPREIVVAVTATDCVWAALRHFDIDRVAYGRLAARLMGQRRT